MLNEPIISIQQAKEYFISMGCSHFHMGREFPQRYEEYKMLEVTQYIRDLVPIKYRVIVSETLNGRGNRQLRTGLIYLAYDLNNIQVAKAFVELSLHFATYDEGKSKDFEMCQEATKLCLGIKAELGL